MKTIFASMALLVSAPALAQSVPVENAASVKPASPLAIEIAGKLFPDGTYRRMLGPQMTQMMSGMTDSMSGMPIGPMLKAAGLPETAGANLNKATIGEVMAILDPAYQQRMRGMIDAMFSAMIPLFEKLEPDLRAGLAVSLDNRFSVAQLSELRAFFATPTGSAFASQQMLLFMDPAVMGKMQAAMPKIMGEMPQMMAAAAKANEGLPKVKKYQELTPAERKKLSELLGGDLAVGEK